MTNTQLLDLPNELLLLIFQYLTSIELLKTFFGAQSHRIQALLQSFISFLDISKENNEWIETYLSDVLVQRRIVGLRLEHKQIRLISKYLSSSAVESIEIISCGLNDELSEDDRLELRRCLKKLYITVDCPIKKDKLVKELFPRNPSAEYFSSTGRFFYPDNDQFYTFPDITHLSIELCTIQEVFILLRRLPHLQSLKVNFRYQHPWDREPITNVKNAIPCKTLRHVNFTGYLVYFHQLDHFFVAFGSPIESLTINIKMLCFGPNGRELEHDLLDKMPHLSSFDFLIKLVSFKESDVSDIKTFQSATWQKFNPIVCYHGGTDGYNTICTLPYKFDHFSIFPEDFVSSCVSNRPVSLCFERVRSLSIFVRNTSSTPETFKFVQNAFPNVKTLCLISKSGEIDLKYYSCYFNKRQPGIFSNHFRSNTTIQLLSVTEFYAVTESYHCDNETLRCLFHLLPNLITLRTNCVKFLGQNMATANYYDEFVMNSLTRIKLESHNNSIYWSRADDYDIKRDRDKYDIYYVQ